MNNRAYTEPDDISAEEAAALLTAAFRPAKALIVVRWKARRSPEHPQETVVAPGSLKAFLAFLSDEDAVITAVL